MMKNKFIKLFTLLLATSLFIYSCDNTDEFTGDSLLDVNIEQVTIDYPYDSTVSLIESATKYPFSISISNSVDYDIVLKLDVLSGNTATKGTDFNLPNEIIIPAGSKTGTASIEILSDEEAEGTESFTVVIGSRALNANVTSKQVSFNISNLEESDLVIGLDWAAAGTATDNYGNAISAYDLADLRLLLTDVPFTSILDDADGASAESYILSGQAPDGEYYIAADFYAANTDIPMDLDLTVTFDQIGVISHQTHSFPAALNTSDFCPELYTILVKITKTGNSYAFEEIGQKSEPTLSNYVGTWTGEDIYGPTEIETRVNADGKLEINGVGVTFMTSTWGEVIIDQQWIVMDVDMADLSFTISEQYYMETTYDDGTGTGAVPQDLYYLKGSGTIDPCTKTMDLSYDFVQGGTSYVDWLTPFGYEFVESNTLN